MFIGIVFFLRFYPLYFMCASLIQGINSAWNVLDETETKTIERLVAEGSLISVGCAHWSYDPHQQEVLKYTVQIPATGLELFHDHSAELAMIHELLWSVYAQQPHVQSCLYLLVRDDTEGSGFRFDRFIRLQSSLLLEAAT